MYEYNITIKQPTGKVSQNRIMSRFETTPEMIARSEMCWYSTGTIIEVNGKAVDPSIAKTVQEAVKAALINNATTVSVKLLADVNLDGKTNIRDVTAIQRHAAEIETFTEEQLALADTNGDGKVDINDATYLHRYLAEFDGIVLGQQPLS